MGDNDSPMPIIGVYVAAASMACSFAMFLNSCLTFINSFPKFNVRFSGNFFPLNATWLTLLAVATKLAADLTTPKSSYIDNEAKIMNTVFLTVAMGNFFPSLGSMNNADIVTNLTALSILVITVVVDLYIQLRFHVFDFLSSLVIIIEIPFLFCTWMTIVCTGLAIPAIKKRAESKYQKLVSDERQRQMEAGQQHYRVEELRLSITKYWVMAATGSPQLLMKRLVTFVYTNIICLLSALISVLGRFNPKFLQNQSSEYKWSIQLILVSQYYVTLPTMVIAIIFMISVVGYKYENNGIRISREEVTIESYWTEKLVEWMQQSIPIKFKRRTLNQLIHNIKSLILTFCILIQSMFVMCCKLFHKMKVPNDKRKSEVDLNCFVILLEGEKQFPKKLLRGIINRVDKLVEMGKKKRPQNLFNLLNQSFSFGGVVEFDSNRVPNLLSGEPPNCWTLPVVTLSSIAIAIPNIASQHVDWLVSSANEGIRYASLIDVLDEKYVDLERKTREINSAMDIIRDLADVAKKIVMEFSSKENRMIVENPLYWPANVLAANSMYRITRTILLYYEDGECQAEELFRKLICMIANILAACLTNLPHMIYTKCISSTIEERLESVRDAAIIFGETEDILKLFEECKLSSAGPSQPLCIDEWRGWIEQRATTVSSSATSNGASSVESNEHVVLQMQA
nr:ATP-dependent RNA helicase [Ipomoea batatas]